MPKPKPVITPAQSELENDLSSTLAGLAEDFAATAVHAANWKLNYFGTSASSRLAQAVADMELATARIKASMKRPGTVAAHPTGP